MKSKLLLLALFLIAGVKGYAQTPVSTSNPNDEWQIKWSASDEFNNDSPDWSKWIRSGASLPNTTAWKWDNDRNVNINEGVAELTMRHNDNNANDGNTYFKSGILKSYNTFTTGYFEARIKGAAIGEGVCPSFWLYSNFDHSVGNGQAVYSEIDIVELQQYDWYEGHQDDIYDMDLNLHAVVKENGSSVWRRPKAYPDTQLNKWRSPWDCRDDFHVYGCEVNEDEIIWYVDGVEVARKPNTYWYRPMNVTLSLGLRKPFVQFFDNRNNAIDPTTNAAAAAKLSEMPTTMYVDYVRVWEKTGTSDLDTVAVGDIGNADFEENGLEYWKAGAGVHSVVNNNVQSGSHAATVSNGSVAQIITLKGNTTYTVSAYGKLGAGATNAFMGVNDAITNQVVQNVAFTSSTYEKGTISFTTGAEQARYKVWFWSGGDAYCDNFTIVEGEPGEDIAVTGVTVAPNSLSLIAGQTGSLSATVSPSNASNKSVSWSTSNASVATVSGGNVTAVGAGSAVITATTADGGFTATATVSVVVDDNLLENGGLENADLSDWNLIGSASVATDNGSKVAFINGNGSFEQLVGLQANTTYRFAANVKVGAAGQSVYLGVTNNSTSTFIENKLCTSTSYQEESITFTTGNSNQTYKVWMWNNGGGAYYADDFSLEKVNIGNIAVTGVTLAPGSVTLDAGETTTLNSTVSPSNADNKSVTWSSNNTSVATVNNNGVVTAVSAGNATITVRTNDGGFTAACAVTVAEDIVPTGLPQVGEIIWLKSSEDKYLTVNTSSSSALQATKSTVGSYEQFRVVDGNGFLALESIGRGRYVSVATAITNNPLRCSATGVFNSQKFTIASAGNGTISIQSRVNGNYCQLNSGSAKAIEVSATSVTANAKFTWGQVGNARQEVLAANSISLEKVLNVYPNPYTSGVLNINFGTLVNGSFKVLDISGKRIYSAAIQEQTGIQLAPQALGMKQGIYFIQLSGQGSTLTNKLVIK